MVVGGWLSAVDNEDLSGELLFYRHVALVMAHPECDRDDLVDHEIAWVVPLSRVHAHTASSDRFTAVQLTAVQRCSTLDRLTARG